MNVKPAQKVLGLVLLGAVLVIANLAILALLFWYYFLGPGYYAELRDIQAEFSRMTDVKLLEAYGDEDVTLSDISASIQIKGKGKMKFSQISRQSFKKTPHSYLSRIGPYEFKMQGEGYVAVRDGETGKPEQILSGLYGGPIDIGREGEFASFFPFEMANIRSVIEHYDDICAVIAHWPVAPEYKRLQINEEEYWDYCVKILPE